MRDEMLLQLQKQKTCAVCQKRFDCKSERVTCSRSCAVSLSWKTNAEQRRTSIVAARRTPESRARTIELNNERWSRPGEREKLSERNRKAWSKPRTRARLSKAIKKAQNAPDVVARASAVRRALWCDETYRSRVVEAMRRHHATPEARAKFSALLAGRWNDPIIRARMTAGNKAHQNRPEAKAKASARMRERWATDENYRATVLEAMRLYQASPEATAIKSVRMKALWADPSWRMRQRELIARQLPSGEFIGAAGMRAIAAKELNGVTDLIAVVDRLIPRGLPDFIRADVCQDIMVALLEGSLKLRDLKNGAKVHLTQYRKMFPDKFGPISLDAPIPGTDGLTIMDTLSNDTAHF